MLLSSLHVQTLGGRAMGHCPQGYWRRYLSPQYLLLHPKKKWHLGGETKAFRTMYKTLAHFWKAGGRGEWKNYVNVENGDGAKIVKKKVEVSLSCICSKWGGGKKVEESQNVNHGLPPSARGGKPELGGGLKKFAARFARCKDFAPAPLSV